MEHDRPSRTAGHVAALRGLGVLLPPAARLVDDPFGAEWTGWGWLRRLAAAMPAATQLMSRPMWHWLLYMQVRTYALDQEIIAFAQAGGRQLALLGAGLDARALRLRRLGLRVFEIDHPATQARTRKRKQADPSTADGGTTFVAWDFEHQPLGELPQRLAGLGWQRDERGCVVWEGVTMYLSEAANAATFAMLADVLAPGSIVAFTYFAKDLLAAPGWRQHLMRQFVAHHGEPWIFGWEPDRLPAWLAARGFVLERDDSTEALAGRLLPADLAARLPEDKRRVALARRVA